MNLGYLVKYSNKTLFLMESTFLIEWIFSKILGSSSDGVYKDRS